MANDKTNNLQDTFLNSVRKAHVSVTVFLVSGVKLQGVIAWFDNFCLLLKRDQQVQLVYKHSISTIMPMGPVKIGDHGESPEQARAHEGEQKGAEQPSDG